jgi:non-ribosomal peptide synthetase component F
MSAVVQRVEHHARTTPDAIALRDCVGPTPICLTYAQLHERSTVLALELSRVIGANQLVGVFLSRSIDIIVAAIGIWKSRCAYLPLDPMLPTHRTEFVLRDSGARAVVCDSAASCLPLDLPRSSMSSLATTDPAPTANSMSVHESIDDSLA